MRSCVDALSPCRESTPRRGSRLPRVAFWIPAGHLLPASSGIIGCPHRLKDRRCSRRGVGPSDSMFEVGRESLSADGHPSSMNQKRWMADRPSFPEFSAPTPIAVPPTGNPPCTVDCVRVALGFGYLHSGGRCHGDTFRHCEQLNCVFWRSNEYYTIVVESTVIRSNSRLRVVPNRFPPLFPGRRTTPRTMARCGREAG